MHTEEKIYAAPQKGEFCLVRTGEVLPLTEENLWRFMATWNACEGLSTEQVEGLDVARLVKFLKIYFSEEEYLRQTEMHDNYTDRARSRNTQANALKELRAVLAGLEKVTP